MLMVVVLLLIEANLEDLQVRSFEVVVVDGILDVLVLVVPENICRSKVKRDLFARIDAAAPPSTILASNTSR